MFLIIDDLYKIYKSDQYKILAILRILFDLYSTGIVCINHLSSNLVFVKLLFLLFSIIKLILMI